MRQKTTLAQRPPPCDEEKIVQFHQYVIRQRQAHNYPLHLIGNMDEVPVQFDMPSNRTVNAVGDKTVKIRTTGNEKNRLTVVLACAGDSSKLKQLVIFKGKTMPKIQNKHGVVVTVQEKGWMDSDTMKIWIKKVWRACIGGLSRRRSLLVFDSSKVLQPLDICLNKPFKDRLRQRWMTWMAEGIHELTPTGKISHLRN